MIKPTYVEFPLDEESSRRLEAYTEGLQLTKPKSYHATAVYSKTPIKYEPTKLSQSEYWGNFTGIMLLGGISRGSKISLVLSIDSVAVSERHHYACSVGASWDYMEFTPHITIAYNIRAKDLLGKRLEVPSWRFRLETETVLRISESGSPIRDQ